MEENEKLKKQLDWVYQFMNNLEKDQAEWEEE